MKALVTVNQKSVGIFYQMPSENGIGETQAEMHKRILDVITYRYGACNLNIEWL